MFGNMLNCKRFPADRVASEAPSIHGPFELYSVKISVSPGSQEPNTSTKKDVGQPSAVVIV